MWQNVGNGKKCNKIVQWKNMRTKENDGKQLKQWKTTKNYEKQCENMKNNGKKSLKNN